MKKLLSLVLAMMLILSLVTAAFADYVVIYDGSSAHMYWIDDDDDDDDSDSDSTAEEATSTALADDADAALNSIIDELSKASDISALQTKFIDVNFASLTPTEEGGKVYEVPDVAGNITTIDLTNAKIADATAASIVSGEQKVVVNSIDNTKDVVAMIMIPDGNGGYTTMLIPATVDSDNVVTFEVPAALNGSKVVVAIANL